MIEIRQKVDKKEFYLCNMYYLRKYFGLKEALMLSLLLVSGLVLFFAYQYAFMLLMFVIVCLAILLAVAFYFSTVKKGWQFEFEKTNVKEQLLTFTVNKLKVVSLNENGEKIYEDEFDISSVDRIAFLKGKIYYYQGVATMFYIFPDAFEKGNYEQLREKLSTTLDINKFKMKAKRKTFPRPLTK